MAKKTEGGELISFDFRELSVRTGQQWKFKMYVRQILAESLSRYRVHLTLNEDPYLKRIAQIESDIRTADPDLFMNKKARQKELRGELEDANAAIEEARKNHPDFEFDGSVEEVKYNRDDNETFVVFSIARLDALKLADLEPDLSEYKVALEAQ